MYIHDIAYYDKNISRKSEKVIFGESETSCILVYKIVF